MIKISSAKLTAQSACSTTQFAKKDRGGNYGSDMFIAVHEAYKFLLTCLEEKSEFSEGLRDYLAAYQKASEEGDIDTMMKMDGDWEG